jgi:hypothetical protein
VVLLLADSGTGLLWPPLVARGEESAAPWQRLFERARRAGLDWDRIRGVTSDGAQGIIAFLRQTLGWVQHQRCVPGLSGQDRLAHLAQLGGRLGPSDGPGRSERRQ